MKLYLPLILVCAFSVSCMPHHPQLGQLPTEQQNNAKLSKSAFDSFLKCAKQADGNDAKYTENCSHLFNGKKVVLIFSGVSSLTTSVAIEGEVPSDARMEVNCTMKTPTDQAGSDALTKALAKINRGDAVILKVGDAARATESFVGSTSSTTTFLEECELVEHFPLKVPQQPE